MVSYNFNKRRSSIAKARYDLADEQLMEDIKDDFDRMSRIMRTNKEIDDTFDNHGENYITVFYLRTYEFSSTDDIEPIEPLTRRMRNAQKMNMCF